MTAYERQRTPFWSQPVNYEEPPVQSIAGAITLLEAGGITWDDLPPMIIGVALKEADRQNAERFCAEYVGAMHEDCRRAGFIGLAHLARRFGACDPRTWSLVLAARDDAVLGGTWQDVVDDFTHFVDDARP